MVMCARQGKERGPRGEGAIYFCTLINLAKTRRQVEGGFRLGPQTDYVPYDCFGISAACDE